MDGTTTPTTSTTKAVVRGFLRSLSVAAASRRDEGWRAYLAPDVIDHNQVIFGEADEPGAAIEGFRQQLRAFGLVDPGRDFVQVEDLIAEGPQVVARLRLRGTHVGEHPRMPRPTGRSFNVEQIWIFTVQDGLIREIRAVSDRLGMFQQLGWDWPEHEIAPAE
jgi:predicted ester cyclase